jgi:predicted ester cyclase
MSTEANKAIMRRYVNEVFNQGKLDLIDEVVLPTHRREAPNATEGPGPEGNKQVVLAMRKGIPDLHVRIEEQIAEGDRVVTRFQATGTHLGELMGAAPTGKRVTLNWLSIDRFESGKLVGSWVTADGVEWMQQLDYTPKPS